MTKTVVLSLSALLFAAYAGLHLYLTMTGFVERVATIVP